MAFLFHFSVNYAAVRLFFRFFGPLMLVFRCSARENLPALLIRYMLVLVDAGCYSTVLLKTGIKNPA